MNMCCFVGRIANDLELQQKGDMSYLRFRVAVRRPIAKKDDEPDADFVPCVAFRKTAEFIANNFKKGDYISLVATYRTDKYVTSDGNTKYSYDFYVEHAEFCSPRTAKQEESAAVPVAEDKPTASTAPQAASVSINTATGFGIELPF